MADIDKKEIISILGFAKLAGVDESTVRQYIREGRFSAKACITTDKGLKKLMKTLALAEWVSFGGGLGKRDNATPKKNKINSGSVKKSAAVVPGPDLAKTEGKKGGEDDDEDDDETFTVDGVTIPGINKSKAKTEYYKALTAQKEYDELSCTLVIKADVYKKLYDFGSEMRKAFGSVPDQVIDDILAVAPDRTAAIEILRNKLEAVLLKLADDTVLESKRE